MVSMTGVVNKSDSPEKSVIEIVSRLMRILGF